MSKVDMSKVEMNEQAVQGDKSRKIKDPNIQSIRYH